jgi:hypothetical protein
MPGRVLAQYAVTFLDAVNGRIPMTIENGYYVLRTGRVSGNGVAELNVEWYDDDFEEYRVIGKDFVIDVTEWCNTIPSGAEDVHSSDPEVRVVPNPCRHGCRIVGGAVDRAGYVAVFDVSGRLVKRIDVVEGREASWDGRDQHGERVAAGAYWVRVGKAVRRLVLVE